MKDLTVVAMSTDTGNTGRLFQILAVMTVPWLTRTSDDTNWRYSPHGLDHQSRSSDINTSKRQ